MKKTYGTKKKAFTLIEVILALVVSTIIATYAFKTMQKNDFLSAVRTMQNTVKSIINNDIASTVGYARAQSPLSLPLNCSPNYDFTGLTTQKLSDCIDWSSSYLDLNTNSPVEIIGSDLLGNYGQCSVQVQVVATDANLFDFYIDCSNVNFNARTLELVEESIKFVFEKELSTLHVSTSDDATSLTANTGDSNDGKIRARFGL